MLIIFMDILTILKESAKLNNDNIDNNNNLDGITIVITEKENKHL